MRIIWAPEALRHFSARLEPLMREIAQPVL
jgi:hypothetical protein